MSKLVIDEAALKLASEKLAGQPILAGPGGGFLEPGVLDLAESNGAAGRWEPADDRTRFHALGAEACRDILYHTERISADGVSARALRGIVVPTCSLMDVVDKLLVDGNGDEARAIRESWPDKDQKAWREIGRRLRRRHLQGPVRTARNRIGAHLDPSLYQQHVQVTLGDVLAVIGDSLALLLLASNYPSHRFSWIRNVGSTPDGSLRVVETMFSYPVALRWLTDADGRVVDVGHLLLAADPRHEVRVASLALASVYNKMASLPGVEAPMMSITYYDQGIEPSDPIRLAALTRDD